ncbi:hypothetical protein TNCV_3059641 [Trichonephila clavipes]|nr:hypothetical protein TNCV_3059641 [Trichonephila clavipes]
MSFDNTLWKAAFTGIASKTNADIMVPQLKRDSSEKTTWCQSAFQALCWVCCRRRSQCAANVDKLTKPTLVAVDQRAVNCLEEAVRSFTAMRSRCRSSPAGVTFRRPLPGFPSCSVLVGPLLPNSHHCGTVRLHTSSYCAIGKSSFSKADNLPRSNSMECLLSDTLATTHARWRAYRFCLHMISTQQITRGFLLTDFVILNHGQVTRRTPEPSLNFHITPTGGRLRLDIFNMHRPPLHGGSLAVQTRTHDTPATAPLPWL